MPSEPPVEDMIRYDVMVQDALVGVVRRVMQDAATRGLPGEHHFYISFRTHAPGVRLSARLREKHPEEMTIVLQHQFWDLHVGEHGFEVGLSFGGTAEKLGIPFEAMTGFFDPSVQFGLKFAADEATADNDMPDEDEPSVKEKLEAITEHEKAGKKPRKGEQPSATSPAEAEGETVTRLAPKSGEGKSRTSTATKSSKTDAGAGTGKAGDATTVRSTDETAPPSPDTGAAVVSLDAFRKKK